MHSLITALLGIIGAWSCRRHNGPDSLGCGWRVAAGVAGGLFPHLDIVFQLLTIQFGLAHHYAESWSLLLAPVYALLMAFIFQRLARGGRPEDEGRHSWQQFYLPVLCGLVVVLLFSMLTAVGVMPFAPVWRVRVTGSLIFMFDYVMLGLCVLGVVVGLTFRAFVRDIARITLGVLLVYALVLLTFQFKAADIAKTYAQVRHLDIKAVHTLPQPLSPLHWRIIVETQDDRLYDTLVHLFLKEEREVRDDTSRAGRIAALYKPVDKAWWRIYNRFGRDKPAFVADGWQVFEHSAYGWFARFAVYQGLETYKGLPCAQMRDLRYEGAKSDAKGTFLMCKEGNGWMLFRGRVKDSDYDFIAKLYDTEAAPAKTLAKD
ncbi:MAG: hypothetical protein GC134_02950 [Proteobacteria bacterium]|nr:hypothetical protein [Pseudomonadota bacterium]